MILTAVAACAVPAVLKAQKGTVHRTDGKTMEFESIHAINDDRYGCKTGQNILPVSKKDIKYIETEKPQVIADADKAFAEEKFAEAAKLYADALEAKNNVPKGAISFKELGWSIYCRYKQAESLQKTGQLDDALKIFVALNSEKANVANPADMQYVFNAQLQIGETWLAKKDYAQTARIAKELSVNQDPKAGFCGYLLHGKIYRAQAAEKSGEEKNTLLKKAALAFFGAALLFEKEDQRPEALYLSWEMLTELKDVRAESFKKILEEKYPDNPYTKKLK